MIFAKSKKQASRSAFWPPEKKFQFFSDLSFSMLIVSFLIDAIIPTRLDAIPSLNGAHAWLALGFQTFGWDLDIFVAVLKPYQYLLTRFSIAGKD